MNEKGGRAKLSLQAQADETGYNKRQIIEAHRELEAKGWLQIIPGRRGRGNTTQYVGLVPADYEPAAAYKEYDGQQMTHRKASTRPPTRRLKSAAIHKSQGVLGTFSESLDDAEKVPNGQIKGSDLPPADATGRKTLEDVNNNTVGDDIDINLEERIADTRAALASEFDAVDLDQAITDLRGELKTRTDNPVISLIGWTRDRAARKRSERERLEAVDARVLEAEHEKRGEPCDHGSFTKLCPACIDDDRRRSAEAQIANRKAIDKALGRVRHTILLKDGPFPQATYQLRGGEPERELVMTKPGRRDIDLDNHVRERDVQAFAYRLVRFHDNVAYYEYDGVRESVDA
jgi:hypothetical protein